MTFNKRLFYKETYKRFRILFNLINILKIIIAFPIAIILIAIYPFVKIKFGRIHSKSIGNYVSPLEIFYYESKEFIDKNQKIINIWCHDPVVANKYWINKVKKKILILPGIIISPLIEIFETLKLSKKFIIPIRNFKTSSNPDLIKSVSNLGPSSDIHKVLLKYPPLIKFNRDELSKGEIFLKKIGFSKNDKFVCIHNRSNSYRDEPYDSVRNSSFENFKLGIKFLLENNIKVIRVGRDEKNKFEFKSDNFFDYSTSNFQNDFLDFYLISKCEFFVGAPSGPQEIARIFRKPIMVHNIFNLKDMIHYVGDFEKIILPKKIWSKNKKSYLNFGETIKNEYNSKVILDNNLKKNLEIIENTEEELYHGIKEMYEIVILKSNFDSDQ